MLYTPIHGAYTELYAGLSPEITEENNGGWRKCFFLTPLSIFLVCLAFQEDMEAEYSSPVNPWGSIAPLKKNLQNEDLAKQFYEWTDEQVKHYA